MSYTVDQREVERMAVDQGWEQRQGSRYTEYRWAYIRGPVRLEIQFGPGGRISKVRYSGPDRQGIYARAPIRALDNEIHDDSRLWEPIFKDKMSRVRKIMGAGPRIELTRHDLGGWSPAVYGLGAVELDHPSGFTRVYGRGGFYTLVRQSPEEVDKMRNEAIEAYEREIEPLVRARAQGKGVGIKS